MLATRRGQIDQSHEVQEMQAVVVVRVRFHGSSFQPRGGPGEPSTGEARSKPQASQAGRWPLTATAIGL